MFISNAYAQTGGAGQPGILESILPLALIFVIFYFLLIRPQQKKMKQHREMVSNVRRGDKVVTGGGIVGTVSRVSDDGEVTVEIAEGVKVKIVRDTISAVVSKTEPVSGGKDDDKSGKSDKAEKGGDGGSDSDGPGAKGLKKLLGGK